MAGRVYPELVEETSVTQAVDDAVQRWPRASVAWENVTWAIMVDPDTGVPVNERGTRRLVIYPGSIEDGEPTIRVVYETRGEGQIILQESLFLEPISQAAGKA